MVVGVAEVEMERLFIRKNAAATAGEFAGVLLVV
jgi:hypothetical protein